MRYIKITLAGFKRLGFGLVKKIEITPINYIQLILGINGYGKSMLMKEISPLPGNKNDYYANGYKEIEIEHNNKRYLLRTEYNKSVKCSFMDMDNHIELNTGATQAVQCQLVNDIFGYTQDIHYLLHSREMFTEMSPKRRREWFIQVSNMNYDYAISIWNKLKDLHRDTLASIKEHKRRLSQESTTILSEEEINKLSNDIAILENNISTFQKHLYNIDNIDLNSTKYQLDIYKEDIQKHYQNVIKTILNYYKKITKVHSKDFTMELLPVLIENEIKEIQDRTTRIKHLSEKIDNLQKEYSLLDTTRIDPNALETEKANLISNIQLPFTYIHDKEIDINRLSALYTHLTYWVNDRPNTLKIIPKEEYLSLENTIQQKQSLLEEDRNKLQQLRIELQLQNEKKEQHKVNCPNCRHDFIPGYDPIKIDTIKREGSALKEKIENDDKILSKEKEIYIIYKESLDYINKYKLLKEKYQDYAFIFSLIDIEKIKENNPTVLHPVEVYLKEEERILENKRMENRIAEIDNLLNQLRTLGNKDKAYYQREIEKEEDLLKQLYIELESHKEKKMDYESIIELYKETELERKKLLDKIVEFDEIETRYVKGLINTDINKIINQLKIEVGEKIKLQQSLDNKLNIIQYIDNEITTLSTRGEVLSILVNELSPQKGLIAEGLSQFIEIFITYMNALIKEIWSYPLEIKPPTSDDAEDETNLTFRFPMIVGLNNEEIDDVALGSSGIKEVINLAFKLTAMKSLKLDNYPLFLDEFGASFDQQHRINATNVIKRIAEERIHSQLFMVSHYESSYGSITDCDVILLSEDIAIPFKQINQYVNIERGQYE